MSHPRTTIAREVVDKLHRDMVGIRLDVAKILEHYGLPKATEAEVDEELNKR